MLFYTNYYKPKIFSTDFFWDGPEEISSEDFELLYSGLADFEEEDIREEAFTKFSGMKELGPSLGLWIGKSMCAGDIVEFVSPDSSKITEFCLASGWKRVQWIGETV